MSTTDAEDAAQKAVDDMEKVLIKRLLASKGTHPGNGTYQYFSVEAPEGADLKVVTAAVKSINTKLDDERYGFDVLPTDNPEKYNHTLSMSLGHSYEQHNVQVKLAKIGMEMGMDIQPPPEPGWVKRQRVYIQKDAIAPRGKDTNGISGGGSFRG